MGSVLITIKMNNSIKFSFSVLLITIACQSPKPDVDAIDPAAHRAEVDDWHAKRVADLKGDKGWLNLAGLFWLSEGINTFGSDSANTVVFPVGKIPPRAGFFLVKNGLVKMSVSKDVEINSDSGRITESVIFNPDSTRQPILTYNSLQWFVIKRDNQVGVRLRDLESEQVKLFEGIDRYEVNSSWRIPAKLEVPASPKTIDITNILGQTTAQKSPGTLVFEIDDKTYTLDALTEGDKLFIIFGDSTNGTETYPAGRYLYAAVPGPDGTTVLDFNKSYNPPCAFTPFATCPLPPKQNILQLSVLAGEKNYHDNSH